MSFDKILAGCAPRPAMMPLYSCPMRPGLALRSRRTRTPATEYIWAMEVAAEPRTGPQLAVWFVPFPVLVIQRR